MTRYLTPQSTINAIIADAMAIHDGNTPTWGRYFVEDEMTPAVYTAATAFYHHDGIAHAETSDNNTRVRLFRLDGDVMDIPADGDTGYPADRDIATYIEKAVHDITDWAEATDVELRYTVRYLSRDNYRAHTYRVGDGQPVKDVERMVLDDLNSNDGSSGDYRVVRYEQAGTIIDSPTEFNPFNGGLTIVIEGSDTIDGEQVPQSYNLIAVIK